MTLKLAYNTGDQPVLVDEAGYTIGARGWGVVDSTSELTKAEYEAGRLVDASEDALAGSENEEALAAVAELGRRREALEAAQALTKDELIEALPEDVVAELPEGGDGKPAKADLVEAATADPELLEDVEAPPAKPAKKSTSRTAAKK
jgi:hypothetical protein